MANQCTAITKGGARCRHQNNLSPESLCLHHDPERKRQVRAMRSRGGKASAKKKVEGRTKAVAASEALDPPKTHEGIVEWHAWLAHAGATDSLDLPRIDSIRKVLVALSRVLEKTSLADEIEALREQLAELRRGSMGIR